jgi:hypothetical protein
MAVAQPSGQSRQVCRTRLHTVNIYVVVACAMHLCEVQFAHFASQLLFLMPQR